MNYFNKEQNPLRINTIPETPKRGLRQNRYVSRQRRHVSATKGLAALLLVICLVLLSARAFATSDLPAGNDAANSAVATPNVSAGKDAAGELPRTRIETDEQSGEIRFIIDGETAAILSGNGLIVDGNINGHAFLHGPNTAAREADSDQVENSKEGGAP